MAYSTYDDIYWSDVDLDSDYTTNEKFLSRYEPSQQHPLSDFSNTNEQLTVINGYLYRVDKESGEIHHYGDDWQEYVVGGDIVNHIFLQYSIADTAKSKQAHREYSNELGDKSTNAAHNGIKEYAHILNKRDFEKLFILCNEVDRRNLVFIKRKKLCDILNTSYDHLKRVLNLLEEKQYIKVDKAEHEKDTFKIWVNPSFIWKGDYSNRWLSAYMQGFDILPRIKQRKESVSIFAITEKALNDYDVWYVEHGHYAPSPLSRDWYEEIQRYDNAYGESQRKAKETYDKKMAILNSAISENAFIEACLGVEQYRKILKNFK